MTSLEIALTFSLRSTRDIPSRSNSKRNKQYRLTVNWQASIYFPIPHQSGAPFASVQSFLKQQWYRAGVFFFLPSPSPLSFFRPRTYRKGYYFYSPGHNQNWIYDFLSSDWLTQNQNIAQTAKGLRPREMAAMSRRKPLQIYSWYDRILPIYRWCFRYLKQVLITYSGWPRLYEFLAYNKKVGNKHVNVYLFVNCSVLKIVWHCSFDF